MQVWTGINLFQPSIAFHTETSYLFCWAKQMTGFYMKCNTGPKWVSLQLYQHDIAVTTKWTNRENRDNKCMKIEHDFNQWETKTSGAEQINWAERSL